MFSFEITFPIDFVWNISRSDFNTIFENNPDLVLFHDIIWRLTSLIGNLGLILLMYVLELHILEKKLKFIPTIIVIIGTIPAMIFGAGGQKDEISLVRLVMYVGNVFMILVPFIYFYLATKTSGRTRKRALSAGVGSFIMFVGVVLNSSIGKTIFENIAGITGLHLTYVLYGSFIVVGTLMYLNSVREISHKKVTKKDVPKITEEYNEDQISFIRKLGIDFTRPVDLTEEEITFHKEQKICLVCKGKISRLNYVCPGCDALYCAKCSEVLSSLENACWVCETPFDETKPVKLEVEEEYLVEPEIHKKRMNKAIKK